MILGTWRPAQNVEWQNNVSFFTHTFLSKVRPEGGVNAFAGMESRAERAR